VALIDNSVDGLQAMMDSVAGWVEKLGLSINVAKTKWMAVGNLSNGNGQLMMNGEEVEPVEEFFYLDSILTNNGNCCKDVRTRIAKANSAFSRLNNTWHDRTLGLSIKILLYTSIVKAILLYSAETWPLTKTETQRLEAANHKWLRRILNVSWKDMVRNESIREQTGQEKLELAVQECRLRWLGHAQRMSDDRIAKQVLH